MLVLLFAMLTACSTTSSTSDLSDQSQTTEQTVQTSQERVVETTQQSVSCDHVADDGHCLDQQIPLSPPATQSASVTVTPPAESLP